MPKQHVHGGNRSPGAEKQPPVVHLTLWWMIFLLSGAQLTTSRIATFAEAYPGIQHSGGAECGAVGTRRTRRPGVVRPAADRPTGRCCVIRTEPDRTWLSTLGDALRLGQITCRLMVRQIDTPVKKRDDRMTFVSLSPASTSVSGWFQRADGPQATATGTPGAVLRVNPSRHRSARTGNNEPVRKPQAVRFAGCE